jgi:hypothetical protein
MAAKYYRPDKYVLTYMVCGVRVCAGYTWLKIGWWRPPVNTAMNFGFRKRRTIPRPAECLSASEDWLCFMELFLLCNYGVHTTVNYIICAIFRRLESYTLKPFFVLYEVY